MCRDAGPQLQGISFLFTSCYTLYSANGLGLHALPSSDIRRRRFNSATERHAPVDEDDASHFVFVRGGPMVLHFLDCSNT